MLNRRHQEEERQPPRTVLRRLAIVADARCPPLICQFRSTFSLMARHFTMGFSPRVGLQTDHFTCGLLVEFPVVETPPRDDVNGHWQAVDGDL